MNPDELELAPGIEHQNLEGLVWQADNEDELREGLEKAFDYRDDVTTTKKDGTRVEGYLFDRFLATKYAGTVQQASRPVFPILNKQL